MNEILNKYAKLLVNYCLEIKAGEKVYIKSSTLAEPLIIEVYREVLRNGAFAEVDMAFANKTKIFFEEANEEQLLINAPFNALAIKNFDAFLSIRAPHDLEETKDVDKEKLKIRQEAGQEIQRLYFERTADRSLKRSLCQYPTQSSADAAGMSLEEYEHFVFNACHLYAENPEQEWLKVRHEQQKIVDFLNQKNKLRYKCNGTDISFSVEDRIWINSDGRNNMPSGEVFSGPVEHTVSGTVHFNYPSIFLGQEVEGITLWVDQGEVKKWEAKKGKELLDKIFAIEGATRFGEVAIGTNYNIQRATKNILFDEKIGGTIHMAVGQSYKQTGGLNKSSIHWDMITDMRDGGQIFADDELIYENGQFLIG
jgi:aminopeptidase